MQDEGKLPHRARARVLTYTPCMVLSSNAFSFHTELCFALHFCFREKCNALRNALSQTLLCPTRNVSKVFSTAEGTSLLKRTS
jgi:hypothetical protein